MRRKKRRRKSGRKSEEEEEEDREAGAQALSQHPLAPGPSSLRSGVLDPGAPSHPGLCSTPKGAQSAPFPAGSAAPTWGRDWAGA